MTEPTLSAVAAQIDPVAAQRVVAGALAIFGSLYEWDGGTAKGIFDELMKALPGGLPRPDDQSGSAMQFWTDVDESR
jgi:hypothetical protein